ncbi:hypothetical protein Rs2_33626 [Raphanus sativus]|nr:hypothetical protein Rs2_33626 [Raphanus sativus]
MVLQDPYHLARDGKNQLEGDLNDLVRRNTLEMVGNFYRYIDVSSEPVIEAESEPVAVADSANTSSVAATSSEDMRLAYDKTVEETLKRMLAKCLGNGTTRLKKHFLVMGKWCVLVPNPAIGFLDEIHSDDDALDFKETVVLELWRLEDGEEWSRKSLALKPCQRHLLDDPNSMDLTVHGTTQNNEVILASLIPCFLLYYDLIKNDLRKLNIIRPTTPDQWCVTVMDKCESIMHLKT